MELMCILTEIEYMFIPEDYENKLKGSKWLVAPFLHVPNFIVTGSKWNNQPLRT